MDLRRKSCAPVLTDTPKLAGPRLLEYKRSVGASWELKDRDTKLERGFVFKNFREAVDFADRVAEIAETENHHPDIRIHDYKKVGITLRTHAIGGLHENDFIIAAKIDALVPAKASR